ncbi:MAG: acyl-phosphate glycerol 3-phosphate acyltransferase [Ignavibacteriales bacterium CG07_land_8_20_14_0_80_59_12]|nr:MAG: acyl-phosphate glycerol 3-phosphate acyltransferase [Ignavibacteriales bacterium CG07_land_8_20_14_0_80_59_12]
MSLLITLILSYLVGSVPTSIIVTRLVKGVDIRTQGSGNAGGTNVVRTLGLGWGALVIIIDAVKGFLASALISQIALGDLVQILGVSLQDAAAVRILAGCAAVAGHVWSVFAGFRGGKGVSTAAGMLLGVAPAEMLASLVVFLVVVAVTKYVSLGSILAAVAFPVTLLIREDLMGARIPDYLTLLLFSTVLAFFLILNHRANMKRLIAGTEHRFGTPRA